ncbi:outer membrane protein, adhesin transport system [Tistlia consotensis]|uniref:Outer membrane protein, adhesin transport system n=1 Tax=Tistlia consotensis USBA 355 TaxID=560819 RepID=A0A1Y6BA51_9PROT|nr:TolC family outer membrane protein [Tistlia consotensis]SME92807.1 outer membrane protein, adhesin transport system [Tistlia consotensis USBA 355]SNR28262.1 outer membrane protein, adhesin transport system [Tistlia consotensis]
MRVSRLLARALRDGSDHSLPPAGLRALAGGAALALALAAQPGLPRAETLSDSVALAVSGHPQVRGAEAGYRASERAVEVEKGGFLPSVEVTADTGYQHATRGPDNADATKANLWRRRYRGALSQLLFDGFATSNRVEAADSRARSSLFELYGAADEVALRAIEAHLAVVLGRRLVDFARENVALHRRIFGDVEEAARRGGGSTADVDQVRTRRAFAESQLRRLQGDLQNAEADYIEAVGAMPGSLERPAVPLDKLPPSVEDALQITWKSNPRRRAALAESRAAGHSADAATGSFYPTVDVELAHEGRKGVSGEPDFETDSTALLQLRWNLYNGGADTAARRRALEQENQARLKVYEIDRRLRQDLETAYTNYRVATDQVALLRDRVATAEKVTVAYGEQFKLRQRTILDLLDSGNELFVARVDLARTELDQVRAAYAILTRIGTVLPALDVKLKVEDVASVPEREPAAPPK